MDFVLGAGDVAIEVKGSSTVDNRDLRPLRAFAEEHRPRLAIVVCNERAERRTGGLRVIPWRDFLRQLWDGAIIR